MAESLPTDLTDHQSDDEFEVDEVETTDLTATLERLKEFAYYLVENVELNLNMCLSLLEERDVPSKQNSLYTTALSKLLLAVPKVGSALGNALAKGEIVVFDKIDKKNSRKLADLVYHFSDHKDEMRNIFIQSALDIFFSFEHQFMRLTCNGGPKRVMQKLAKDATDRIFNYFLEMEQKKDVTRTEVAKGVLYGDSKRNKRGIREGKTVMNDKIKWKTCKLYQKTGVVIVEEKAFFKKEDCKTEKYGHRRLLPWEIPEEIKETWEQETGFEVPNYKMTEKDVYLKSVRDYVMSKNPIEEAKLERENYSKEALEDRRIKHEEVLKKFQEHFKELLEELEQQYKIILDNQRENKVAVEKITNYKSNDKTLHQEISTKLDAITKDITDTKELIERCEAIRKEEANTNCVINVEQVKKVVQEESKESLENNLTDVVREKLAKNDPGPKIPAEVNRALKRINIKWRI